MKIALLSPYPDVTNFGLRTLSGVLREAGHATSMLFLPDLAGEGQTQHAALGAERYPPEALRAVVDRVGDARLVGISVMTHYFDSAVQLTAAIKARYGDAVAVIWGGFHPSVRPEETLAHADYAAVGDAEALLLELVRCMEAGETADLSHIPSLVWRDGQVVRRNTVCALEQELDRFPAPDFSLEDHWVLDGEALRPMDRGLLLRHLRRGSISQLFGKTGYQTMTGRGCPHACSYCGNSFYRSLYKRQRYVRFRSVEHVLAELEDITRRFPEVDLIWFSDDSFFARPEEDYLSLLREYKARIGLPFYLLASPGTFTEARYAAAVDAGLLCIQMGIEHGSPRIQELFGRKAMDNASVLEAARIIAKYTHRTAPPHYDLVYDLAWETLEDRLATLELVSRLPKPYRLQVFSILYYPGTPLHTLAVEDGLLVDERDQIYDRMYAERHDSYTNTLLFLARRGRMPHPLLRLLIAPRVVGVMTSEAAAPAGEVARVALSALRRLSRLRARRGAGDLARETW